jgi:hypothetical protein
MKYFGRIPVKNKQEALEVIIKWSVNELGHNQKTAW